MSEQRISDEDLDRFLRNSRNAIMETNDAGEISWRIDGMILDESRARRLAEYCSITGQALTTIATIEGALNIARRTLSNEIKIAQLNKVITELKEADHHHWWRRG